MNILVLTWGIILILFWLFLNNRYHNIFHPITFFVMFQIIGYVLPLFIGKPLGYVEYTDENCVYLVLFETIFILSVCLGFYSKTMKKQSTYVVSGFSSNSIHHHVYDFKKNSYFLILFLYLVGFASKVYMLSQMGGIAYIMANPHAAYNSLITGSGAYSILSRLMLVAIVCMFEKTIINKRVLDKFLLVGMSAFYMFSYLVYSSRGPALELVLVLFCCYSMNKKKISLTEFFKPKYLIILVVLGILSYTALSRRVGGTTESMTVSKVFSMMIDEFNRADRDIFSYSYFKLHPKWFGKSYIASLLVFVPSATMPGKPVVDDGILLMNLINGQYVDPFMARDQINMVIGSIPFTSQGLAFANFGMIGLVIIGLLTGKIYKYIYNKVIEQNNTTTTLIYFYMIYTFGFTSLFIQNVVSVVFFSLLAQKLIYKKK